MLTDDLLIYIFNDQPHLLAQQMAVWLASSRRFTDFVDTFRDKIRKKIRATPDEGNLLDLQLELEAAYLLLQERSLSLVYEPQPVAQSRCPDYAVTYTSSLTFMLEVTRLRAGLGHEFGEVEERTTAMVPTVASTPHPPVSIIADRLADTISDKLGQLLPQRGNVLLIGIEALPLTASDLRAAALRIQQRAERNDAAFLQRYRFRDRADFFNHYQRLSEILVRDSQLLDSENKVVWVNPRANHPLPSRVRTTLYRAIGG